mgnify:CR=1 FL=1|tara:strand:- start:3187 stop:3624 length:438 start_codon:yes stop_codon:yes gene_type:complete
MSEYQVKFQGRWHACDDRGWVKEQLPHLATSELENIERHVDPIDGFVWRPIDWNYQMRGIPVEPKIKGHPIKNRKQPRYQDAKGEDWIDECARTLTPEEFRGAMMFTMGKYIRRMGKKDDVKQEVGKLADYANRWLQYESQLDDS